MIESQCLSMFTVLSWDCLQVAQWMRCRVYTTTITAATAYCWSHSLIRYLSGDWVRTMTDTLYMSRAGVLGGRCSSGSCARASAGGSVSAPCASLCHRRPHPRPSRTTSWTSVYSAPGTHIRTSDILPIVEGSLSYEFSEGTEFPITCPVYINYKL